MRARTGHGANDGAANISTKAASSAHSLCSRQLSAILMSYFNDDCLKQPLTAICDNGILRGIHIRRVVAFLPNIKAEPRPRPARWLWRLVGPFSSPESWDETLRSCHIRDVFVAERLDHHSLFGAEAQREENPERD